MSAAQASLKSGTPFERLWPAAAFQFCLIASLALLKPAANALVLSRFSAGAMPWLYLGAALATAGVAAYTASRGGRLGSVVLLAFRGESVDDAAVAATFPRHDDALAHARRDVISALKQVHAVLTPEQRAMAADWLAAHDGKWV